MGGNDRQTPAPINPSPETIRAGEADRAAVAGIMQMLEVDRVDAAATLCRELIRTGGNSNTCFPAILKTAEVLVESGRYDQALRDLVTSRDVDGLLAAVTASGLRGLGGAGFPTATKWNWQPSQRTSSR